VPAGAGHAPSAQARDAASLDRLALASLENADEGLIIVDRGWRVVFANAAAEGFLQRPRADLLGYDLRVLLPDARDRRFGVECRRAVAENAPVAFEEFYPDPLNAWFEVRAFPSAESLSILFRDVTERRRIEKALRQSEERYRALFSSMTEGFAVLESIVDQNGVPCDSRFLEINPAFETLTGMKRDDLLGRLASEVLPEDNATLAGTFGAVAITGEPKSIEHYSPRLGRHYVVLAFRPAPGQFAIVFHDVTERLAAEAALARSEAALQRANGELLAANEVLRHSNDVLEACVTERTADLDRRTAQLQALARDLSKAEEAERRKVAEIIHDQLQQLLSVARIKLDMAADDKASPSTRKLLADVDGLLADSLAIARSLTAELRPEILSRNSLATALAWIGRWYKERFGLQVAVDADEDPDTDDETRAMLFRSVRELLVNVVKHAHVASAKVRLSKMPDGRAVIMVSDEGAGFNPESLRAWDGSSGGFGLFSLRERLETAGGRLEVDSAPGRGARFTIVGPAPGPEETPLCAPAQAAAPRGAVPRRREGLRAAAARRHKR
jgi:PAS domain S-box-containing protein